MPLDHRELGRDLAVYATDPLAGSGLPLWLPDGAIIRNELQRLAKDLARGDGCVDVFSPVLGKVALFERSGHLAKFADDMFPPMKLGEDEVVLRPANCPHHALIYAAEQHSYRDLPVRLNECAAMFRNERSGVITGLSRVRQINLDDTHVFCRPDQVGDEAARGLRAAIRAQQILGLPIDYVRLSKRDDGDGWLGTDAQWVRAERALLDAGQAALADSGLPMREAAGEAAFYGPKFDLQVIGHTGKEETIATVQLDFNQPERFDLTYIDHDGSRQRLVMVHRGTVGSMERVTAALLERYQGRLPLWIAPIQLAILPVAADHDVAARHLADEARAAGLRATICHDGSLGGRIRHARGQRATLIAVLGDSETAAGTVSVTDVSAGRKLLVSPADLVQAMRAAYEARAQTVDWDCVAP